MHLKLLSISAAFRRIRIGRGFPGWSTWTPNGILSPPSLNMKLVVAGAATEDVAVTVVAAVVCSQGVRGRMTALADAVVVVVVVVRLLFVVVIVVVVATAATAPPLGAVILKAVEETEKEVKRKSPFLLLVSLLSLLVLALSRVGMVVLRLVSSGCVGEMLLESEGRLQVSIVQEGVEG